MLILFRMTEEQAKFSQEQILDLYFDHLSKCLQDTDVDTAALNAGMASLVSCCHCRLPSIYSGVEPNTLQNTPTTDAITVGVMNDVMDEFIDNAIQAALSKYSTSVQNGKVISQ